MKTTLSASLLALTLSGSAHADPVDLAQSGGALPGTTSFELVGTPGDLYLLIVAAHEQATALPWGATLDIPLDLLFFSFQQPGFVGLIGAAGASSVDLYLPVHPGLVGATLSFQALSGGALADVSNLVRLTPQSPGTFARTLDAPDLPVAGGALAPASDGLLNLVGGSGPAAQTYDPDLEEFELAGASFGVGLLSQSTALPDGRILFTGGLGLDGQPTAAAAVYDPVDGSTTALTLSVARAGHGATVIGDGRVLITGGFSVLDFTDILGLFNGLLGSSEFFDPATDSFGAGPGLLEPRALHSSTPLATGGALIAGGVTLVPLINLPTVSSTAYEYSSALGVFGLPKFMNTARLAHSATLLDNGRVLIAGGLSFDLTTFLTSLDPLDISIGSLDDCETYKTGFFGGFSDAGTLSSGRAGAGMVALPGARALIAGGFELQLDPNDLLASQFTALADADLFDGAGTSPTGSMQAPRTLPLLFPLEDGTVLTIGGGPLEAEVYQP